jgi:hypothetical protein
MAVRDQSGEWTTRRVQRLYRTHGHTVPNRRTHKLDLAQLARQGLLICDDTDPGRRCYRLNYAAFGGQL